MHYTSFEFAAFFAITLVLFSLLKTTARPYALLVASYVFYTQANPWHLACLFIVTCTTYVCGHIIARNRRLLTLLLSLLAVVVPLLLAKYTGFALDLAAQLGFTATVDWDPIVLPIGISFYTFQAISYLIDVYRGDYARDASLLNVSLYLAFFPQVLAGPIERARDLIPQLKAPTSPSFEQRVSGFKCILWGACCKLVVADKAGVIVSLVYGDVLQFSQFAVWSAIIAYSIQIYFDFAGYIWISRGLGKLLGVSLRENFDRPYLARSLREFWRRWHITLHTWLRDYIYIPLLGPRPSYLRIVGVVLVVFTLSGLWHGAAINFVLWGVLHGVLFLISDWCTRLWCRLRRNEPSAVVAACVTVIQTLIVFTVVSLAWIPFRISEMDDALAVLYGAFTSSSTHSAAFLTRPDVVVFALLIILFTIIDTCAWPRTFVHRVPTRAADYAIDLILINLIVIAIVLFGSMGHGPFIYFRF